MANGIQFHHVAFTKPYNVVKLTPHGVSETVPGARPAPFNIIVPIGLVRNPLGDHEVIIIPSGAGVGPKFLGCGEEDPGKEVPVVVIADSAIWPKDQHPVIVHQVSAIAE